MWFLLLPSSCDVIMSVAPTQDVAGLQLLHWLLGHSVGLTFTLTWQSPFSFEEGILSSNSCVDRVLAS